MENRQFKNYKSLILIKGLDRCKSLVQKFSEIRFKGKKSNQINIQIGEKNQQKSLFHMKLISSITALGFLKKGNRNYLWTLENCKKIKIKIKVGQALGYPSVSKQLSKWVGRSQLVVCWVKVRNSKLSSTQSASSKSITKYKNNKMILFL